MKNLFLNYCTILILLLACLSSANADFQEKPVKLFPEDNIIKEDPKLNKNINVKNDDSNLDKNVSVEILKPINPSSVGLIDEMSGGYTRNLWLGSNLDTIQTLISLLPSKISSPTIQKIYRKLLLSSVDVPIGEGDPLLLLEKRISKLWSSGYVKFASDLSEIIPKLSAQQRFSKYYIDYSFLSGDNQAACKRVEEMFSQGNNEPYWLKNLILCRIFSEDIASARLAIDLLLEVSSEDEVFFSLVSNLLDNESITLKYSFSPSPLHIAMLRASQLDIPNMMLYNPNPDVLTFLALAPNITMSDRIRLAHKAAVLGLLDSNSIAQIYSNIIFKSSEIDEILLSGNMEDNYLIQPLLYQLSRIQDNPETKAEALYRALSLARKNDIFSIVSKINIEMLSSIEPTNNLIWFARDAAASLIISEKDRLAQNWFNLAWLSVKNESVLSADTVLDLWPSANLTGLSWSKEAVLPWVEGISLRKNFFNDERIETTLSIFDAMGFDVPDEAWLKILKNMNHLEVISAPPAYLRGFNKSVQSEKIGETLLYTILIFGKNGPEASSSATLISVVNGLKSLGLSEEANSIVREVLISFLSKSVYIDSEKDRIQNEKINKSLVNSESKTIEE